MNNCVYAKRFTHAMRSFIGSEGLIGNKNFGPLINVSSIGKLIYFSFNNIYIVVYLCKDDYLEFSIRPDGISNYENILFRLGSGYIVSHYGKIKHQIKTSSELSKILSKFGSDPTRTMNSFLFFDSIKGHANKNRNRNIRSFLLDQKIIAGLDCYYVDKILNKNFINPKQAVCQLEDKLFETLVKSIVSICNSDNSFGLFSFTNNHKLEKCVYCHSNLYSSIVASRACYYCRDCQNG